MGPPLSPPLLPPTVANMIAHSAAAAATMTKTKANVIAHDLSAGISFQGSSSDLLLMGSGFALLLIFSCIGFACICLRRRGFCCGSASGCSCCSPQSDSAPTLDPAKLCESTMLKAPETKTPGFQRHQPDSKHRRARNRNFSRYYNLVADA